MNVLVDSDELERLRRLEAELNNLVPGAYYQAVPGPLNIGLALADPAKLSSSALIELYEAMT